MGNHVDRLAALSRVYVKSYMRDGRYVKSYYRDGFALPKMHLGERQPAFPDTPPSAMGPAQIRLRRQEMVSRVRKYAAEVRGKQLLLPIDIDEPLPTYTPRSPKEQTTSEQLRASVESGVAHLDQIEEHASGWVEFKDGRRALVRIDPNAWYEAQAVPASPKDLEAQAVGDAVGAPIAHGYVDIAGDLYTELVPGEIADDWRSKHGDAAFLKLLQSPEGHALGLFDYAVMNSDRHDANWMVTPEGHVVGIDHDRTFWYDVYNSSPFVEVNEGTYSKAEIEEFMRKVKSIRGKFKSSSDFDGMMARLQYMLDHDGAYDPYALEQDGRQRVWRNPDTGKFHFNY